MRVWLLLLGGVLVWAADFFLLYTIASVFLTTPFARLLTVIVTVAALAADAWLLATNWRRSRQCDGYDAWLSMMGSLTAAISAVAVAWQGFPAVLI